MRRRGLLTALLSGPLAAEPLDEQLAARQQAYAPRLAWRPEAGWRAEALSTARRLILQPGDDAFRRIAFRPAAQRTHEL